MLLDKGISGVTGFTSTNINQGSLESTGLEVELSANDIKTDNFSWNLNVNFSKVDTEITDTGNDSGFTLHSSNQTPQFRTFTGGQVAEF